jgi:hypothetical protein
LYIPILIKGSKGINKRWLAILLLATAGCDTHPKINPFIDYHLHLLGPYALPVETSIADRYPPPPVTTDQLIASIDKAGIRRGLVLSTGFIWVEGPE